ASASQQTVKVWDVATGRESLTFEGGGSYYAVAFSPDGQRLASARSYGSYGSVKVWDAATGRESLTMRGHTREVFSLTFSPDGRRLASASFDGMVKLWDMATGQETLTLVGHPHGVRNVAFSPDGHWLASSGVYDGGVKLWDARPLDAEPAKLGPTPR